METASQQVNTLLQSLCECEDIDSADTALLGECESLWSVNNEAWEERASAKQVVKSMKIALQLAEEEVELQKRIGQDAETATEKLTEPNDSKRVSLFDFAFCCSSSSSADAVQTSVGPVSTEGPLAVAEVKRAGAKDKLDRATVRCEELVQSAPNMLAAAQRAEEQALNQFAIAVEAHVKASDSPSTGGPVAEWARNIVELLSLDKEWCGLLAGADMQAVRSQVLSYWERRLEVCDRRAQEALTSLGRNEDAVVELKTLNREYDAALARARVLREAADEARQQLELAEQCKLEEADCWEALHAQLEQLEASAAKAEQLGLGELLLAHEEFRAIRVKMSTAAGQLAEAERSVVTRACAVSSLAPQEHEAERQCAEAARRLKVCESRLGRQAQRALSRRDITRSLVTASFPELRTDDGVAAAASGTDGSSKAEVASWCYELLESSESERVPLGLDGSDIKVSGCLPPVSTGHLNSPGIEAVESRMHELACRIQAASDRAFCSLDKTRFSRFLAMEDAAVHWDETVHCAGHVERLCIQQLDLCRQALKDGQTHKENSVVVVSVPKLLSAHALRYIDRAENDRDCWRELVSTSGRPAFCNTMPAATPVNSNDLDAAALEAMTSKSEKAARAAQRAAEGAGECDVSICFAVWDDAVVHAHAAEGAYRAYAAHLRARMRAAEAEAEERRGDEDPSHAGEAATDSAEALEETLCLQSMWGAKKAWYDACKAAALSQLSADKPASGAGIESIETRIRQCELAIAGARSVEAAWGGVVEEYRCRRRWGVHPESLLAWFDRAIEDADDNQRRWAGKVRLQETKTIQVVSEYQTSQLAARLHSSGAEDTKAGSGGNSGSGLFARLRNRSTRAQTSEMVQLSSYAEAISRNLSTGEREYNMVVYAHDSDDSSDEGEAEPKPEPEPMAGAAAAIETDVNVEAGDSGGPGDEMVGGDVAVDTEAPVLSVETYAEEEQLEMVLKSMKDSQTAYESTISALEAGLAAAPASHRADWAEDIRAAQRNKLAADARNQQARAELERSMKTRGVTLVAVRDLPEYQQYVKLLEVGASIGLVKEKLIASGADLQPEYLDDLDRLVVCRGRRPGKGLRGKFKKWLTKKTKTKDKH